MTRRATGPGGGGRGHPQLRLYRGGSAVRHRDGLSGAPLGRQRRQRRRRPDRRYAGWPTCMTPRHVSCRPATTPTAWGQASTGSTSPTTARATGRGSPRRPRRHARSRHLPLPGRRDRREYEDDGLHREYVTDDAGTIVKVIVPNGADAGDYLVDLERPRRRHGPVSGRDGGDADPGQQLHVRHLGPADHGHPQLHRRPGLPLPVRRCRMTSSGTQPTDSGCLHARPPLQPRAGPLPAARSEPARRAAVRLRQEWAGHEDRSERDLQDQPGRK